MSEKPSRYELLAKKKKKGKPRRKNKKFKDRLPNELIYIPNPDKHDHESWHKNRNIASFPRPFRMILAGGRGSGKTNTAKNILLRQKWDNMYLVHVDRRSKEWDDFGIPEENRFDTIPNLAAFEHEGKSAIIIEDWEIPTKSKQQNLSKLFRFASTHLNISVLMLYQDLLKIPTICRRVSNIFCIWKIPDRNQLNFAGKRIGLEKGELPEMLDALCPNTRDFLCFDMTQDTPYPIRKNLFQKVTKVSDIECDFEVDYEAEEPSKRKKLDK